MRIEVNIDGTITEHEDAPVIERPIEEIEAERVLQIKVKAAELINSKYPDYKQLNILRVGTAEELEAMSLYIDGIRAKSNKAEQYGTKVEDIKWR